VGSFLDNLFLRKENMKCRLLFTIAMLTGLSSLHTWALKLTVENKSDKDCIVVAKSIKGHEISIYTTPGKKKSKDIIIGVSLDKLIFYPCKDWPRDLGIEYNVPPELKKGAIWYLTVNKIEYVILERRLITYGQIRDHFKVAFTFELYKGEFFKKKKSIVKTTVEREFSQDWW
jgi:hypothetical protein